MSVARARLPFLRASRYWAAALVFMVAFAHAQPAEDPSAEPPAINQPGEPSDPPRAASDSDARANQTDQANPEVVDREADAVVTQVTLEGGILQGRNIEGVTLWRADLGTDVTSSLLLDDRAYAAQSLYVVELDGNTGTPLERHAVPHPPVALEALPEGVMIRFANADPVLLGDLQRNPQPFGMHFDAMMVLRESAASDDPTNPWVQRRELQRGLPSSFRVDRLQTLIETIEPLPFFESAAMVTDLLDAGLASWPEVEPLARAAVQDMLKRGYDPRLVSSEAAINAYGFPFPKLEAATNEGRLDTAVRLLPWAAVMASPEVPASYMALQNLADALSIDGRKGEATEARTAAREVARFATPNVARALVHNLARFGWWGVASLIAATLLLGLTLLAKIWPAQSFKRKQLHQQGRRPAAVLRLTLVRHVATTEKLVMLILLITIAGYASLAAWYAPQRGTPQVLQAGTFASSEALAAIEVLPASELAAWMRGLHYAQNGDADAAQDAWMSATNRAEVVTNLALLRDNQGSFENALRLDPREPTARYNLGRIGPPAPFMAFVGSDWPHYAVPSAADVEAAALGSWQDALTGWWPSPQSHLEALMPAQVPAAVGYVTVGFWLLLVLVWTGALFVPRPRVSRKAPRTVAYHVLALVLPGAGHADELWGLILLIPFALFAGDLIVTSTTALPGLGVTPALSWGVLAGTWAANTVGFSVEWSSHRRRMTLLKQRNPDLAAAFGLQVKRPVEGSEEA